MATHPTRSLSDLVGLRGRSAVVTGAAMGIGRAVAERLAEAGAAVVLADLDEQAVESTANELRELGHDVLGVRADVSDEADVATLFATAREWRSGPDVLVNNAGIFPTVPVLDMTPEQFDRVIAVNLRGSYLCSRAAALGMRERRSGSIINITSIDALHPSSVGLAHYDASKHGLWGFTKNLALELAPSGIRVNAIPPGGVATPGVARMQVAGEGRSPDDLLAAFLARIPLRRLGDPDEIARIALVLASDLSAYMTGSQVVVDGGALLA